MQSLFETCGYIATFLGTFMEGEILLLTAVLSAKMGYVNYFGAMVAAFLGAYIRDWTVFVLVKKQGKKLLAKKPKLQAKLDKASTWFEKRPLFFLSFYRLMYGFSTAILMLSGLKGVSYIRFGIHSAISTFLWVAIFGGLGFFCADLMLENLHFLSDHKLEVIAVLLVLGLAYWFFVKRPKDKYCFVPKTEANITSTALEK